VGGVDPRLSRVLAVHALVVACLSAAHSLRARGLRRTLLFAALGSAIPFLGELLAIHVSKVIRHHARPQVGGVPLAVALGWYNVGYNAFTVTEHLLARVGLAGGKGERVLAPAAALAATNLDLLLDPCGLDLGLWEWRRGGPYAAEVKGPNGRSGIPALNFAGWIGLISGVALAYRRLASGAPRPAGGRGPALLLLSYYLPAAAWAARRRRRKYLIYSAPFAAVLLAALKGPSAAS
jgi:uncharacterized membrane protein